jgi:hypothetical protein
MEDVVTETTTPTRPRTAQAHAAVMRNTAIRRLLDGVERAEAAQIELPPELRERMLRLATRRG